MRIPAFVAAMLLLVSSTAVSDVRLWGNFVISDSSIGAKFLGEVANDTDEPITNVKVTVTAKNASGEIIDVPEGYVDGFTDPDSGLDIYIPAGYYVPFMFFGNVEAADIASYEVSISYDATETPIPDINAVTRTGSMHLIRTFIGTTFYGEVANNSSNSIYFTKVVLAVKDADGNLVNVDYAYVCGENYLAQGIIHIDNMVRAGETAPFEVMTLVEPEAFQSYYTIINYSVGPENPDAYFGTGDIGVMGDVGIDEFLGDVTYTGEIENNTDRDIYFVSITFVSRNAEGKIIDIYESYIEGTSYAINEGLTTESHIAPGERAPFEVMSSAAVDEMASYEYIINYYYAEGEVSVEAPEPRVFTLEPNYPNPFNPSTTISFTLIDAAPVKLRIYNASGQLVEELLHSNLAAGVHDVQWNAAGCPSGVYFYELTTAGASAVGKMTLMK